MKNLHILPTDKPSRLSILNSGKLNFGAEIMSSSNSKPQNIYITSDEEIKEGDWVLGDFPDKPIGKVISKYGEEFTAQSLNGDKYGLAQYDSKKIILTTDQDLIVDGVQAIDDEFLEWFVENTSCEEVEYVGDDCYYEIIIPQEEPKQETLEEFIESQPYYGSCTTEYLEGIEVGAKWQAERLYSEEDILTSIEAAMIQGLTLGEYRDLLIEQFKNKGGEQ